MKKNKLHHIKSTKQGYKLPEGYFDSVEDAVFSKLSSASFPEKEGFSTPTSYFDKIEDKIVRKLQIDNGAKKLSSVEKRSGFSYPENYLDSVEDTVLEKLKKDSNPSKVIQIKPFLLNRLIPIAAAASLALFIYLNYYHESDPMLKVSSLEVQQWIDDGLITFDTDEIADVYDNRSLDLEDNINENDEEIFNYLDGMDIESMLLEN